MKSEESATQLIDILNGGTLSLIISMAIRLTCLIMSNLQKPATIEEIARVAGLNERYVREWLDGMELGGNNSV